MAEVNNRVHHDMMTHPHNNPKTSLVIYHDALLAMGIANISPERRQAVVTSTAEDPGYIATDLDVPDESEDTGASMDEVSGF